MDVFSLEFWEGLWKDFVEFLSELPLKLLESFLDALVALLSLLPVPDGLEGKNIGQFVEGIPYIPYFLDRSGFAECLALIGASVAFLMVRKVVTLFQW